MSDALIPVKTRVSNRGYGANSAHRTFCSIQAEPVNSKREEVVAVRRKGAADIVGLGEQANMLILTQIRSGAEIQ